MGSSLSPSSPFLSNKSRHCALRPCDVFSFVGTSTPSISFRSSRPRGVSLSASLVEKKLHISWLTPDTNNSANDAYGGWAIVETPIEEKKKNDKGILSCFLMGAGVSVVIFVVSIAYCSFTGKGFKLKFNAPNALQRLLTPISSIASRGDSSDSSVPNAISVDSKISPESTEEKVEIHASGSVEKPSRRVIITVAADSTQNEALQLLKNLQIIEEDVKADELCTRREYARWLVTANSVLERNPKHRIYMLPSGSVVQAFDDVYIQDPDFRFIQALAEAGIILSKLSDENYSSDLDGPESKEGVNFYPESFISRLDLISWKAKLEYSCKSNARVQISTKKVGYMDVSMISPETYSEFFMDMLAGDKSTLRKVFGQSRRFQPQRPATKAQAAVTLTSGRMAEAIRIEVSRLETENSLMVAEMEEIKSALLLRGDIQRSWEEKLNEVKAYGQEVARHFDAAISDLEQEKNVQDKSLSEHLKERSALDCQKKLLINLKEEVNEMSERLAYERANLAAEQKNLEDTFIDLQGNQDATIEAKSILEAETEALRMLRSWVEDEARRSQARAHVLEQVGRRWKWNEGS